MADLWDDDGFGGEGGADVGTHPRGGHGAGRPAMI